MRCPSCGDTISALKAVRLLRAHVNSRPLPRRGRLVVCPNCLAVVPAELSNFCVSTCVQAEACQGRRLHVDNLRDYNGTMRIALPQSSGEAL